MGNNYAGHTSVLYRIYYLVLGICIKSACRFVKYHDSRIGCQCTSDLYALPLTARDVFSSNRELAVILTVSVHYYLMDTCVLCRKDHFKILDRCIPHLNILRYAALKQRNILIDNSNRACKNILGDIGYAFAVDHDLAAPWSV